jgi:hypothetical protein
VQPESYNQQLAADDPRQRVLPVRLGELAAEAQYRLNPLDYQHSIVSPFRGHEASGLLTTPIWKYVKLTPFPDAQVALAFDGGDPALVVERIGRGQSLVFATAASPDSLDRTTNPPTPWTAISSWPSFPPLVHEMLSHAISGRSEGRNVLVGDDLTGVVNGAAAGTQVTLTRPDGAAQKLSLAPDGPDARWSHAGADASGVYAAQLPSGTTQQFAVNLNTRESDLTRFDPELLPSQFSRELHSQGDPPPALAPGPGRSLFRWLLGAMLILVIVEPCLAWYFGRGRG